MAELYGVLDTDTRDWTDGLLSNIFREINKPLPAGKVSKKCSLPSTQLASSGKAAAVDCKTLICIAQH